jgi:DNA-directed RNA polymerase specialized sigma24 family protein
MRLKAKQVGSKAVSVTSIDIERSRRSVLSTGSHGIDQRAPLESAAPDYSDLKTTITKLRSFSLLLCLDNDLADHLVEITLVRAGVCMSPSRLGRNTLGWLCGRLRSYYYREFAACQTSAPADGRDRAALVSHFQGVGEDVLDVLAALPTEQREALVLTEAMGFSRAQAARIASTPMHVFKVRIEEARAFAATSLSARLLSVIHADMARFTAPHKYLWFALN